MSKLLDNFVVPAAEPTPREVLLANAITNNIQNLPKELAEKAIQLHRMFWSSGSEPQAVADELGFARTASLFLLNNALAEFLATYTNYELPGVPEGYSVDFDEKAQTVTITKV